jgi:hypothetical protein
MFYFDTLSTEWDVIEPSPDYDYKGDNLHEYLKQTWAGTHHLFELATCPDDLKQELFCDWLKDYPDCKIFEVVPIDPQINKFILIIWTKKQYENFLLSRMKYHHNKIERDLEKFRLHFNR